MNKPGQVCPFCPHADLAVRETYEFPLEELAGSPLGLLEARKDTGAPYQTVWCRGCESDLSNFYTVEYDGLFTATPTDLLFDLDLEDV